MNPFHGDIVHDEPAMVIKLPATVGLSAAAFFTEELIQRLPRLPHQRVVLDASSVRHVDVFGLAAVYESYVIAAFHHCNLRIIQPSAPMARALRASRLHQVVPVEW